MRKPKHTPGPWTVAGRQTGADEYNPYRHVVSTKSDGTCKCIAEVPSSDSNARLIAAAPELYEVCKTMIDGVQSGMTSDDLMALFLQQYLKMKDAVAKAEGSGKL